MSTNIKLLIALLLGAAIGALMMKKIGSLEPQLNIIDYGQSVPKTDDTNEAITYDAVSKKTQKA